MTFDEYQRASARTLKNRRLGIEGHEIPGQGDGQASEALVLGAERGDGVAWADRSRDALR
jgi:hypothetical protein